MKEIDLSKFAPRSDLADEMVVSSNKNDEYSTSVLGIQFTRDKRSTVQIISRYNHTVDNPEVLTEVINSDICRYFCGTDSTFNADKKSFDIDDFVASFILGRTITPYSSMEDIDYVQRLLEKNLYVDYNVNIRGEWDETLTNTLYNYQKSIKSRYKDRKKEKEGTDYNIVIPTGYFDIITEKYMLQDMQLFGEDFNNAYSSI